MRTLELEPFRIKAEAESSTEIAGGTMLEGAQVRLDLPFTPRRYYRHGWQSWSLTAWTDPARQPPVQKPPRLHPLQIDPLYARHPAPNGSWVGAVEADSGQVVLLGSLGVDAHVALHGQELHGWYEEGSGAWFVACGAEELVFQRYAELLGERLGRAQGKPAPRVWCSWYSLYSAIDEPLLLRVFEELGDLPFDVLQVDDGWQVAIGDWQANEKFPSGMEALASRIRGTGRRAGLWLAPLLAVPSSRLYRQHRDWLLRDQRGGLASAGFLWGEPLYALDTTHPQVLAWLRATMEEVRAWGYDYLKLDFLFAGALPGKRHAGMPRERAYRQGLQAMREGLGEDAYLLGCGAPILPSLGPCDALRVGPDVGGEWDSYRDSVLLQNPSTPGVKNAIRTSVNRIWLRPLTAVDPDVVYFTDRRNNLREEHRRLLQDLALVCDFKATSDLPRWLAGSTREHLASFLAASPRVARTGRTTFELDGRRVDFRPAMTTPEAPGGLDRIASAIVGWAGNQAWAMRLLNWMGKRALERMKREL